MPLFMAQFAYTPEAWASLMDMPQDRAAASDSPTDATSGSVNVTRGTAV